MSGWAGRRGARRAGVLVFLAVACQTVRTGAGEPARAFLEGLRARGYYDTALEYLDQMANSPLAPVELKEAMPYERGLILVEASRAQRDAAIRDRQLDEAQAAFRQFVEQRADHPQALDAQTQLGNLLVDRARMKMGLSRKGDPAPLLGEARALYDQAYQVFRGLKDSLRQQLERIPKELDERDPQQEKVARRREQLYAEYLQSQLLSAAIREEAADTVSKDSPDYGSLLDEAASLYQEINAKYPTKLVGLNALLFRGRTLRKRGAVKEALDCVVPLLDQPDSPDEFRKLKTRALKLALECWLDPAENKHAEAIQRGAAWVAKARPTDDADPEWLALRLLLAKAYVASAGDTQLPGAKGGRAEGQALNEARRLAQAVARFPGEYQEEASKLVTQLGGAVRTTAKAEAPRTFVEAKDAGREILDALDGAKLVAERVPERIAKEQDAAVKAELQAQLDAAQQTLSTGLQEAEDYLRLALTLADANTPAEDINVVRYFLAYVYYEGARLYEAAVLGEFIARRQPDSSSARPAAQIALVCYLRLHAEAEEKDRSFETQHALSLGEYIAERWPDQPEAQEAIQRMIPLLINVGDFDRAAALLGRIPADSPQRVAAGLLLGHALWSKYLQGLRELQPGSQTAPPAGVDPAGRKAELDKWRGQAEQVLVDGVAHLEAAQVDALTAAAVLSLAQLYVESQRPAEAIALLENATYGPLKLVEQQHAAAQREGFAEETFKTALRAFIAALSSTADAEGRLQKTREVMDAMQARLGTTPEAQQRLVSIYVGLARDLEERLKQAPPELKQSLAKGFEAFLQQLARGSSAPNVLNWVGETFLSLGAESAPAGAVTDDAKSYYGQAAAAFQKILDQPGLEAALQTRIRLRKAEALRRSRDYPPALALLETILRENSQLVNVQAEAARTYQDWAAQPGEAARYEQAMYGSAPDPQTKRRVVLGWEGIANMTASSPKYRDTFHDARHNLALCRLSLAETKKGSERDELLEKAARDISLTYRLYGLGDENTERRYDALLKRIQKAQGKQPLGTAALKSKKPTAPAARPGK